MSGEADDVPPLTADDLPLLPNLWDAVAASLDPRRPGAELAIFTLNRCATELREALAARTPPA